MTVLYKALHALGRCAVRLDCCDTGACGVSERKGRNVNIALFSWTQQVIGYVFLFLFIVKVPCAIW